MGKTEALMKMTRCFDEGDDDNDATTGDVARDLTDASNMNAMSLRSFIFLVSLLVDSLRDEP